MTCSCRSRKISSSDGTFLWLMYQSSQGTSEYRVNQADRRQMATSSSAMSMTGSSLWRIMRTACAELHYRPAEGISPRPEGPLSMKEQHHRGARVFREGRPQMEDKPQRRYLFIRIRFIRRSRSKQGNRVQMPNARRSFTRGCTFWRPGFSSSTPVCCLFLMERIAGKWSERKIALINAWVYQ